jgi:hypothetical protein
MSRLLPILRPGLLRLTLASAVVWGLACSSEPPIKIEDRVLEVACGRCVFEMPGVEDNCPWAAEVDGRHYLIEGNVPHDHNSHEASGICNMPRRARVRGEIRGEILYVSKVELLEPEEVPEEPRFTPADVH